jgi:hypothetical protein
VRKKLVLTDVYVQGIPNFDGSGGCRPFMVIEEEFKEVRLICLSLACETAWCLVATSPCIHACTLSPLPGCQIYRSREPLRAFEQKDKFINLKLEQELSLVVRGGGLLYRCQQLLYRYQQLLLTAWS